MFSIVFGPSNCFRLLSDFFKCCCGTAPHKAPRPRLRGKPHWMLNDKAVPICNISNWVLMCLCMLGLTGRRHLAVCMYVCIRIEIWLQLGYADKDRSTLIIASKGWEVTVGPTSSRRQVTPSLVCIYSDFHNKFTRIFILFLCIKRNIGGSRYTVFSALYDCKTEYRGAWDLSQSFSFFSFVSAYLGWESTSL